MTKKRQTEASKAVWKRYNAFGRLLYVIGLIKTLGYAEILSSEEVSIIDNTLLLACSRYRKAKAPVSDNPPVLSILNPPE